MTEEEDVADDEGEAVEISDKFTVRFKLVNYDGAIAVRETYHHAGEDDGCLHHAIGDAVACALLRLFPDLDNGPLSSLLDGFTAVIDEKMNENDNADLGRLAIIRQRAADQSAKSEQS
jgi:hypothetical protein